MSYSIPNPLCSLADVKAALRITDSNDDYQISMCIDAASREIEQWCGRHFWQTQQPFARTDVGVTSWETLFPEDIMTLNGLVIAIDYAGDGTYSTILNNPTLNADGSVTGGDFPLEPLTGRLNGMLWPYERYQMIRSMYNPVWGGIAYPRPYIQALIKVTAYWGWDYVPAPVTRACVYEAISLFKAGDIPFGATGIAEAGILRLRPGLHPAAEKLLVPYRRDEVPVF